MRKLYQTTEVWRLPSEEGGFVKRNLQKIGTVNGYLSVTGWTYKTLGGQGMTVRSGVYYTEVSSDIRTGDVLIWNNERWSVLAVGDTPFGKYRMADVVWHP